MDNAKLKRLYGRLKGIRELVFAQDRVGRDVGKDYDNIINDIAVVIEEDLKSFLLQKKTTSKGEVISMQLPILSEINYCN